MFGDPDQKFPRLVPRDDPQILGSPWGPPERHLRRNSEGHYPRDPDQKCPHLASRGDPQILGSPWDPPERHPRRNAEGHYPRDPGQKFPRLISRDDPKFWTPSGIPTRFPLGSLISRDDNYRDMQT